MLSRVLEHLVTGEVMQMTAKPESLSSMDHYVKKTYYKTASLIANSSKAIALLGRTRGERARISRTITARTSAWRSNFKMMY